MRYELVLSILYQRIFYYNESTKARTGETHVKFMRVIAKAKSGEERLETNHIVLMFIDCHSYV